MVSNLRDGYIQVQSGSASVMQRQLPLRVFAAGDVARYAFIVRPLPRSGSGCMAALDAEKYLDNLNYYLCHTLTVQWDCQRSSSVGFYSFNLISYATTTLSQYIFQICGS